MDCFEELQTYNEDNIILSIEEKERILDILKENSILNIKKLLSLIIETKLSGNNVHEDYELNEIFHIYILEQEISFIQDNNSDNIYQIDTIEFDDNDMLIIGCTFQISDYLEFEEVGFSDKNNEYYIPLETLIKLEKALTTFLL